MTPAEFRQRKSDAMQARNQNLGLPQEAFQPDGQFLPSYRQRMVQDMHRTLQALSAVPQGLPPFLVRRDANPMLALMGVEGFLMPPHLASYSKRTLGYSGIFQFGPTTFGTYAPAIAERLNALMQSGQIRNTHLSQAITEAGFDPSSFRFDERNIWLFHDNPVVQTVAAVTHHGPRLARIQALGDRGVVNADQQMGLLTISHNIPALSGLIMNALERRQDGTIPASYDGMTQANPALYRGTTSLLNILERVTAYAKEKERAMLGFTTGSGITHAPSVQSDANRDTLTQFIRTAVLAEATRPGIDERERARLGEMIRAIDTQIVADQSEHGYEIRRAQGDPYYRVHPVGVTQAPVSIDDILARDAAENPSAPPPPPAAAPPRPASSAPRPLR